MATTTPNYGWDVPTSTDYVKDGAVAIETLGDDIDASLFSITSGKNVGLVHLNTTTFSAASSVSVDSVFTSQFANYVLRLDLTAVSAADPEVNAYLRVAGVDTTTNYNSSRLYQNNTSVIGLQTTVWNFGGASTTFVNYGNYQINLFRPQISGNTSYQATNFQVSNAGAYFQNTFSGFQSGTLSADGIKLFTTTGTFTGTLRIYGLRNS
jgi:hypothetical protein